ncbi:MAG: cadherin-like domain-containing protein [Phormidium tanganyikae FI6-MK23]|jgi:CSLREA domain-containing protein|nr:cadherin-like domain-containing protein [Phormidium tanganyikae FI6-MK23]
MRRDNESCLVFTYERSHRLTLFSLNGSNCIIRDRCPQKEIDDEFLIDRFSIPGETAMKSFTLESNPLSVKATNPRFEFSLNLAPLSASASQQVLTVNSTADTVNPNDGVLTLREAIDLANATPGSAIINFALGTGAQTITLTGGQLNILDPLIINGTGSLTINGNGRSRILDIGSNASATLSKLNLVNGAAFTGGGAISNGGTINLVDVTLSDNSSTLGGALANVGNAYLMNVTINNNRAINGGGITNVGYLNISNSTISGNTASNDGGGLYSDRGSVEIQSSTFTLNLADSDNDYVGKGGGIRNNSGTIAVQNTIIGYNFTPKNGSSFRQVDVSGSFTDLGYNLIGDRTGSTGWTVRSRVGTADHRIDPRLAPLRNSGGFTSTHALLSDSPALNAGNTNTAPTTDQRGIRRTIADIGAYEALPFNLTVDLLADEDDGNVSAGDVSLREAIRYSAEGSTINFASNLRGTIALDLGELFVNHNLTIKGSGAKDLTISGNDRFRVFSIASNTTVDLSGLTIAHGYAAVGGGIYNAGNLTLSNLMIHDNGGQGSSAIANDQNAMLNLYNSTIYSNKTNQSGILTYSLYSDAAITNLGTMTIENSTISHNPSWVSVFNNGTLTINASTIADTMYFRGNEVTRLRTFRGIGVYNGEFFGVIGVTKIKNSIIANSALDLSGKFISEGYNLIGNVGYARGFTHGRNGDQVGTETAPIDPKLGELKDNDGSTWTRALLAGSSALNAANPYDRPQIDQRGIDRGNRPDIGAYENAPAIARSDSATVRRGSSVTIPVLANDFDSDGDRFTIVSYSNPSGGRLTRNADGTFTYESRFPFLNDFFTYTISDGKGETSTATVQIRMV